MRLIDFVATLRYPNGDLTLQEIHAKTQADAFDMAVTMCDMIGTELICLDRVEDQYKEDLQLEALYEERFECED